MHEEFMAQAILEAKRGFKQTHTNPLVGSVIVKDSRIIARGAHLQYGREHAEKNAIMSCQTPEDLVNSTIYVTLEPCHHEGKQPPCTQAILDAGITKVVVSQLDPNPIVAGAGIAFLRSKGIEVETGVLSEESEKLNPAYNLFYREKRPYILLKQAMTLDGKLGLANQRTQLTSSETSEMVHLERDQYQAILVGSQTVLTDNPSLLGRQTSIFPPVRVVLDQSGKLFHQPDLTLLEDGKAPLLIFSENKPDYLADHVEVITPSDFSIETIITELYQRQIQSIYVEGGSNTHDRFLASGLWDELVTYISPTLIGGDAVPSMTSQRQAKELQQLEDVQVQTIDRDIRISGKRRTSDVYRSH